MSRTCFHYRRIRKKGTVDILPVPGCNWTSGRVSLRTTSNPWRQTPGHKELKKRLTLSIFGPRFREKRYLSPNYHHGQTLNLGIVFGILDYSVDYNASSDIRLMTKIRILYSAVFVYSVNVITENGLLLSNSWQGVARLCLTGDNVNKLLFLSDMLKSKE